MRVHHVGALLRKGFPPENDMKRGLAGRESAPALRQRKARANGQGQKSQE
jgi:hypothetical protein